MDDLVKKLNKACYATPRACHVSHSRKEFGNGCMVENRVQVDTMKIGNTAGYFVRPVEIHKPRHKCLGTEAPVAPPANKTPLKDHKTQANMIPCGSLYCERCQELWEPCETPSCKDCQQFRNQDQKHSSKVGEGKSQPATGAVLAVRDPRAKPQAARPGVQAEARGGKKNDHPGNPPAEGRHVDFASQMKVYSPTHAAAPPVKVPIGMPVKQKSKPLPPTRAPPTKVAPAAEGPCYSTGRCSYTEGSCCSPSRSLFTEEESSFFTTQDPWSNFPRDSSTQAPCSSPPSSSSSQRAGREASTITCTRGRSGKMVGR
ncbi:hypothetical protein MMC13_003662 [Lambiella insularis]|nr:hypothetical protein [Lambiella insularis]